MIDERPQLCPFDECLWSTDDPSGDIEAEALAGGWGDRLQLHLRVVHGAHPQPDLENGWEDGTREITLFGVPESERLRFAWQEDD